MRPRSNLSRILAAGTIATLICMAIFLPEIAGIGWHLAYGPSAKYRGWRIPVPEGWFATHEGDSLALEHMLHFPIHEDAPTVVFLSMHMPKNLKFDPAVWTRVQRNIQNRRGYRLAATRGVEMAGTPGYCWEFVKRRDDSHWWITCLMPSEDLSADFSGAHWFAEAFYAILPQIHRQAGKS